MDDLVERLNKRVKNVLPVDWQKGRNCPECGTLADTPKCIWDMGGACPRHDPDNYDDDPYQEVPDKDCHEAAARLIELEAEVARLREVAPVAKLTIDEWDRAVRSGAPLPVILEIGNGLRNFTCTIARAALAQGEG